MTFGLEPTPELIPYITVVGIDPGMSGGLVFLDCDNNYEIEAVYMYKMPATEKDVSDLIKKYTATEKVIVYLEKVHSMPGQGVASTFKFGMGYGFLRGCLISHLIPFADVPPQRWQKGLFIPSRSKTESKTNFKNRLKAKAQQFFPKEKFTLATCDAALIAEYGRLLLKRA